MLYPESSTRDLVEDLGKELHLNADYCRRHIRRISWTPLLLLLAVCFIAFGTFRKQGFLYELFIAFGGFLLGCAMPSPAWLNQWTQSVNDTLKNSQGAIGIFRAIWVNTPMGDHSGEMWFPNGRVGVGKLRKMWMKFRFPHIARTWRRFFRPGVYPPSPTPLPFDKDSLIGKLPNRLHMWRKKRLLYQVSRYLYELHPTQRTLSYLINYADYYRCRLRPEKISKGVIQFPDE
ncbi:hypothetical protein [Bifidobacterium platyrrhinorum]|uniref:hypothetical protein n=1 Tax=Bifidobacterium platyrrhinorum TaxID=2661628 RepID=UPI0013D7C83D|nr:hypothetical protein [Bifidobacterium platyrrhinorum]